jgi:hypothetical protein
MQLRWWNASGSELMILPPNIVRLSLAQLGQDGQRGRSALRGELALRADTVRQSRCVLFWSHDSSAASERSSRQVMGQQVRKMLGLRIARSG